MLLWSFRARLVAIVLQCGFQVGTAEFVAGVMLQWCWLHKGLWMQGGFPALLSSHYKVGS